MATIPETLGLAVEHHQAGRLQAAGQLYEQILQADPNHADALHLLGVIAHQIGRHELAVGQIRRAIQANPNAADFHSNLASAHEALGQFDEAVASCQCALQLNPGSPDAHNTLGNALRAQGHLEDAVASYQRSLQSRPDCAGVYYNLGNALKDQGKLDQAEGCYRHALQLQPDYADAHVGLGTAFQEQGKLDDALAGYRRALQIQPNCAEAHNNLGGILQQQGMSEDAIAHYRRALQIKADYAEAHNNLGVALGSQGRVDEAAASFRRALELRPDFADALGNLAVLYEEHNRMAEAESAVAEGLRLSPDHPLINVAAGRCEERRGHYRQAIDRLEKMSVCEQEDGNVAKFVRYQLGRLFDRLGQGTRAFAHFTEANRLAGQQIQDSPADAQFNLQGIDTLAEVFNETWVNSWSDAGPLDTNETPVFLIGFPRSGTTLLDVILDSHPEIQAMEEKPAVFSVKKGLEDLPGGYPRAMADLTPPQITELREVYYRVVDRFIDREPGKILVDKHPLNTVHTGLILRMFPTAKFIVALRHPCDACLSCFMQDFKDNKAMAAFFTLEGSARLYDKVMSLWQQYVRVLPHAYCTVRYEDLVDDFEAQTRRLLQFLGLDWDDAVRRYTEHAVKTRNVKMPNYGQVTEPIYKRACNRWHRYAEQLEPIMGVLEPYIEGFGYGGKRETGPICAKHLSGRSGELDLSPFSPLA